MAIHVPINQSTDLADVNLYDIDAVLKGLIRLHGGAWGEDLLMRFGEFVGSSEAIELAVLSNTNLPALHTRTRFGQRIDEVKYDRAYHELMAASIAHGAHSLSWRDSREGAHLVRAALLFLAFQNEAGHCCPISMTHAAIAALRKQPDIAQRWERLITSNSYDRRSIPAEQKMGLTVGMSMTESQGGSDVRANLTTAQPIDQAGAGNLYTLHGWKWFCSAPMSDFFLITAKASKGLSCFLVPRWTPDGKRNNFFILGLKDKLGNRSNASAEIQLDGALGWLIGEEGRGIPTIIEMVNHTRLDCALSSAALMRQAVLQAMHHCRYRSAFGKRLIDQPLMNNVLADLSLESEAALQLAMRVARSYDRAASDEGEALFKRIASAVAKYWICKRAPVVVADALECLGGNGYVEESPMPRLFRESPLLGIWEGSSNVICLDVLRAISTSPETLDALVPELDVSDSHLSRFVASVKNDMAGLKKILSKAATARPSRRHQEAALNVEANARLFVERLALALQASLLVRNAPDFVADAFIASRIARRGGLALGTLRATSGGGSKKIIERSFTLA